MKMYFKKRSSIFIVFVMILSQLIALPQTAHAANSYKISYNISTVAGTGTAGYSGDSVTVAPLAKLNYPQGVAVDSSGNMYIADAGNNVIREVHTDGVITKFAGTPQTAGYSGDGGAATSAQLNYPTGVAVDSSGNMYIADYSNNVIRKVDASTNKISTYAGGGSDSTKLYTGPATGAKLDGPCSVAVDSNGNLYIAEKNSNWIRRVDNTGNISTIRSSYPNEFSTPTGVAVDSNGYVYIADQGDGMIKKYDPSTDSLSTVAGNGSTGCTGDGGPATSAQIGNPSGVAVDAKGNLYIMDYSNYVIRIVDAASGNIFTIAGTGTYGYNSDQNNGPALSADIETNYNGGIAVDRFGNVYFSDESANVVRMLTPQQHVVTYNSNNADSGSVPTDSNGYSPNAQVTVLDNTGSLVKTGYTFAGWSTDAYGYGSTYAAGATFPMSTSDVTLYAKWIAVPTVTAVSPSSGPTAGGTTATITGSGFTGATAVNFGSTVITAPNFTVIDDSHITVTAPAGSAGTVDVTVTTAGGTSSTSSADKYVYTAATTAVAENNSVSLSSSSVTAGSPVTITAVGDRQSITTGSVFGDERYIPISWTSTENGESGSFSLDSNSGSYTSNYTPSAAGSYTVTATFQKQIWEAGQWFDVEDTTDTKTTTITVTAEEIAPTVNGVTITPSSANVVQGGTEQLTAAVEVTTGSATTAGATTVNWTSSDETGKVTVDSKGLVTVAADAAPGTYTITATSTMDAGKHGTATITVTAASIAPTVNGVTITPSSANVVQGGTEQLTAAVEVTTGSATTAGATTVNWTSSDETGKVTVDSNGLVTVAADATPGTYTITATSTMDAGKYGTATIIVYQPSYGGGSGSSSGGGSSAASSGTTINGKVEDGKTGSEVAPIKATVNTESDGTKTITMNESESILLKQADGTTPALGNAAQVSVIGMDGTAVPISSDGTITFKSIPNGSQNSYNVYFDLGNGQKLVIGKIQVSVSASGDVSVVSDLIDPYGIITDSVTGKPVAGADVKLYYANTARNIANGKTPNTLVSLPNIDSFKPNNNANPQISDSLGTYGWMVFPNSDYYIVAAKDGYYQYTSPTISVGQEIVNWNFRMNPKAADGQINGLVRIWGQDRIDTALEIAKANFSSKVSNVVLATASNFPDALAGSALAYKVNAPILLVGDEASDQQKVISYLKENMDSKGTVYILGGYGVVTKSFEDTVTAAGYNNIKRLGGADRYETSALIAKEMNLGDKTPVIIASGENYPDALSISSVAAVNGYPILLVSKDTIADSVMAELKAINPGKVFIVGLEGAVGSSVENQIPELLGKDSSIITRIGGQDRYATSLEIAKYFTLDGNNICIATGNNFPDALAGSVYAAKHNAPIILVDQALTQAQSQYVTGRKTTGIAIFGGEGAVNNEIQNDVTGLLSK